MLDLVHKRSVLHVDVDFTEVASGKGVAEKLRDLFESFAALGKSLSAESRGASESWKAYRFGKEEVVEDTGDGVGADEEGVVPIFWLDMCQRILQPW